MNKQQNAIYNNSPLTVWITAAAINTFLFRHSNSFAICWWQNNRKL